MNGIAFDELERKIEAAAERLSTLREENAELRQQVARLEAQLEAHHDGAESGDEEAWRRERGEVRQRVATLIERLEGLLAK